MSKLSHALAILLLLPSSLQREAQAPELPGYKVPKGYKFVDYVEFTDSPNHGLPHLKIHEDQARGRGEEPEEGWHTLLITPDGKAYSKPVTESLAELEELRDQVRFLPQQHAADDLESEARSSWHANRKLSQVNIGVTTSQNDLSCNGCGPDNRVQVNPTTVYPYMTMGQLIGQLGTSSVGLECTGTLIGNRHVVTAAHCVFDINASRKMVSSLNFSPAKNGASDPYGTINWVQARIMTQFSSQPGYTTTAMNYDFALVTLASDATSGYLGMYLPPSTGETETVNLTTAGYPGSMPSGTMWKSACGQTSIDYSASNQFANVQQCANQACSNILTETCISSDGQSGSAIWDDNYNIRAILTGRVTTSDSDSYNVGTEISVEVYNQIASWYNEDGDSAGNGTLPLAPSGPGSQPKQQNDFVKFWTQNWRKAWFIAVVVIIGIVVAGVLFLIFSALLRCCCAPPVQPAKQASQSRPVQGVPYPQAAPHSPPSHTFTPSWREGAGYNPHQNQFIVNGQVYGTYVGQSPRSYSPRGGVPPTAPPMR